MNSSEPIEAARPFAEQAELPPGECQHWAAQF
jgi:hypothetical protein